MCPKSSREKGAMGEDIARKYLAREGCTILETNFHARLGEIDIIAREKGELVFIEVKSATQSSFGDPCSWVPLWKQQRIIRASLVYLKTRGHVDPLMRYDVIAIGPDGKVTHVRDAFRSDAAFSL